jgi:hypothetical protein
MIIPRNVEKSIAERKTKTTLGKEVLFGRRVATTNPAKAPAINTSP